MILITDLFILISCRLPILFRASCQNQGEAKNWDRHLSTTEVYSGGRKPEGDMLLRKRNKLIFTSSESRRKHLQHESSCPLPKGCSLSLDHLQSEQVYNS